MMKARLFILPVLAALLMLVSCDYGMTRKHIAIYYSQSQNNRAYANSIDLLVKNLKKCGYDPEVRVYYLDADNVIVSDSVLSRSLKDMKSFHPDVILANGDQAVSLLLDSKHKIFHRLPMVYSGVRYLSDSFLSKYRNACGYVERPDYFRTLGLVYTLMGHVPVEVSIDTTLYAVSSHEIMHKQFVNVNVSFNEEPLGVDVHYKSSYDSLSIFGYHFCEMTGHQLFNHFVVSHERNSGVFLVDRFDSPTMGLCSYCNMPIFTVVHEAFETDFNVIGGFFATPEQVAREWVECTAKILGGYSPRSLGVVESQKDYVIDYERLEASGLDIKRLPGNVIFYNRPLLSAASNVVAIVVGTLLLLTLIIVYTVYTHKSHVRSDLYLRSIKSEHERLVGSMFPNSTCFVLRDDNLSFDNRLGKITRGYLTRLIYSVDAFASMLHPDDVEHVRFLNLGLVEQGVYSVRFRMQGRSGGYNWYEVGYRTVVRDDEAFTVGVLTCINDKIHREEKISRLTNIANATSEARKMLVMLSDNVCEDIDSLFQIVSVVTSENFSGSEDEKREMRALYRARRQVLLGRLKQIYETGRLI